MPFRPATQRLIAIADGARSLEVSSTVIGFLPMMADQDGVLAAIRRLAMKDDVRAVAAVNTLAGNRAGKLGDAGWVALRQLYDHDQVVFWQARQELNAIAVNLKGWPAKPAFRTPDASLVWLRTDPEKPRNLELGAHRPDNGDLSSSSTEPSESDSAAARSASSAPGEPMRPSAQAACRRTRGSGSAKAAASAGTLSSVPTFPSATAELRFNPRSLARFMGEPLNAAENSDCDMASSSRASDLASLPDSAGRAANAGSDSSFANLRLYRQTSWEMCRYTHFAIELKTGAKTLRGRRRR
jgi:hypothetical protein